MKILAIDTSTGFAGVGLSIGDQESSEAWYSKHNHGREVMPAAMRLLAAAGCAPSELDAVAVALGPGGFSAVRVGVATAKGLVAPNQKRILGVPTHRIQFESHDPADTRKPVSLIPIGRHQQSYAVFATDGAIIDEGICETEGIDERFPTSEYALFGEGALMLTDDLSVTQEIIPRPPTHLLSIARRMYDLNVDADAPVEPIYARPPTITPPRARR